MIRWAIVFFVFALLAAAFGFGGLAGTAAYFARLLLFLFVVLFIISLLTHRFRKPVL
jgi:uncharacterized membrane protein YtjA (UPF0391 family)